MMKGKGVVETVADNDWTGIDEGEICIIFFFCCFFFAMRYFWLSGERSQEQGKKEASSLLHSVHTQTRKETPHYFVGVHVDYSSCVA